MSDAVARRGRVRLFAARLAVAGVATATLLQLLPAGAAGATFSGTASLSPTVQYVGDTTGTLFKLVVHNTGTGFAFGAVQIERPSNFWTVSACPTAPAGWNAYLTASRCRYRSNPTAADDIAPGDSAVFSLRVTTKPSNDNRFGTWTVTVSSDNNFANPLHMKPLVPTSSGLRTRAFVFEVTRAIITPGPATPGDVCPSGSKSAPTGSTGHTMVICGRNHGLTSLTPRPRFARLLGTFIASHGSFTSGPVAPSSTVRVLGNWSNVSIVDFSGAGLTVVARVGAARTRTSPRTALTGYAALNEPPTDIGLSNSTVDENQPSGTPVGSLSTVDGDAADGHTYALVAGTGDTDNASFAIVGDQLRTAAILDFESKPSMSVRVRTTDPHGASFDKAFTVSVGNVNEAPTGIRLVPSSVAENQPPGTVVGTLSADDQDAGDSHTFAFVAGTGDTDNASFTIAGASLKAAAGFDFESQTSYSTRVRVTDGGGLTFERQLTIAINNGNDLPVVDAHTFSINENSAFGTAVGTATYSDQDSGQTHTFAIVGGNGSGGGAFAIDPNGGAITVKDPAQLDYETTPTFNLTVEVTDNGSPVKSGTATVTVNLVNVNDSPVVTVPASSYIVIEDTPSALAGISATDQDAGSAAVVMTLSVDGGTLTVKDDVVGGVTSGEISGQGTSSVGLTASLAAINATMADANGLTYAPPASTTGTYLLTVVVNDQGNSGPGGPQADTAVVGIDVVPPNAAPVANSQGPVVLDEDATASITLSATDAGGDPLTFSIVTPPGKGMLGTLGTPDCSTTPGTCTASVLYSANADQNGSDSFTFKVNDGLADSNSATVSLSITPVNDPPVNSVPGAQTINEDTVRIFSTGNGNAISIADVDGGSAAETLTLAVVHGSLALSGTSGLVVSGDHTASITATGTLADLNNALDGLSYTPAANFNDTRGSESLSVGIDDQGNSGSGGPLTDSDSIAISISALADPPIATTQSFSVQANMRRAVTIALSGAGGPSDPDDGDAGYTPTFSLASVSLPASGCTGCTIGNVNLAAGTFDFNPPAGQTGPFTVNYTVTDSGSPGGGQTSAAGDLTMTVSGPVIWFVDPTSGNDVSGQGTLASPFATLAKVSTVDASGQRVFLYSGAETGGFTLKSSEWLIGQAANPGQTFDQFFGITPPSGTLARPPLNTGTATVAGTVTLAGSSTVRGVAISAGASNGLVGSGGLTGVSVSETSITTGAGTALSLNNVAGTISLSDLDKAGTGGGITLTNVGASVSIASGATIASTTTVGVDIDGGTGAFTYAGTISNANGSAIEVTNRNSGSPGLVEFSGSVSSSGGTGVLLDNNDNGTVTLSGGLALSTGASPAFTATNGGTVNVTGSANTLTTSTGTALNVSNTTIGASGLTFRSISSNGGANGIVLTNTGSSGGLTVTGNGGACTYVTQTCTGGEIQNKSGDAIALTNTASPSLSLINVHGNAGNGVMATGVSALTLSNSIFVANSDDVATNNEANLRMHNMSGTSTITNSVFRDAVVNNVYWTPSSGSMTLNVSGSTFGPNSASTGGSGLLLDASGTANVTLSISGGTFTGNRGDSLRPAFSGSASGDVTVSGGTTFNDSNSGVNFSVDGNADLTFNVTGSTFLRNASHAFQMIVNETATASSSVHGTAANNVIGDSNADSGSHDANGISFDLEGAGAVVLAVTGNTIRHTDTQGIFLQARRPISPASAGPTVDLTLRNNSVANIDDNSAFPFVDQWGTEVWARNVSTMCLDMANNASTHVGAATDFRLRQRDTSTFKLERFVGNGASTGDVNAYIAAQNPGVYTASSTLATTFTGVADGTCQNP